MSLVRQSGTAAELAVRKLAHRLGYRFRVGLKDLPGRPDIVFPQWRHVIFVHGCFWHQHKGCSKSTQPATRKNFWAAKLSRNMSRDAENRRNLRKIGWRVLVIWECEIRNRDLLADKLKRFLDKSTPGLSRPANRTS
jgi:DNA mismatch endonuclease (patch repair protein)